MMSGRLTPPTLVSAIEQFLQAKEAAFRSKATIAKYSDILQRFARYVGEETPLAAIQTRMIRDFLASRRREGLSASSIDTYFRTLHTFWKWATEEYALGNNPMQGVDRPHVPKRLPPYLTDSECQRMLQAAKQSRSGLRDWAILLTLFDTGIRAGELVGLRVKNVNFEMGTITVYGKDAEERCIPISEATVKALRAYLKDRLHDPEAPVFVSTKTGEALTVCGLREIIRRIARAAGLQRRVYPHLFRHTFAYRWIKMGGNVEKLRYILGHSRLDTTHIYAMARPEDILEEHRRLNPAGNLVERVKVLPLLSGEVR